MGSYVFLWVLKGSCGFLCVLMVSYGVLRFLIGSNGF